MTKSRMMGKRLPTVAFVLLVFWLMGSNDACFHDFPEEELDDVDGIEDPDARCAALPSAFPPALDFEPEPSERVWVVNLSPSALVPFDVETMPPAVPDPPGIFLLPPDSDSNGDIELNPEPILEGIDVVAADAALVTANYYEELLFFNPATGGLTSGTISVADGVPPTAFPFLPPPGTSREQTGISTIACLGPPVGALDSRGDEFLSAIPCAPGVPNSFYSRGTSGAVAASGCLFLSMANPGEGAGTSDPQFLPGAVLVVEVAEACAGLAISFPPTIFTEGFNPTHLTGYSIAGRNFVLVTVSGAIGSVMDNPFTPGVVEGGYAALTDAAIEVIDADAEPPRLVATIPLGPAALTGIPAIDPTGSILVVGSAVGRGLLAVDLTPLLALPPLLPGDPPIVLDGSDPLGGNAVLRNADNPILIPARTTNGAALATCPGHIEGVAFNHAGDRIYATDFCDGTLSIIDVIPGDPPSFPNSNQINLTAPIDTTDPSKSRGPGALAVRPGDPGGFTGPDVFVLISQPEGLLCGLDIESSP